MGSDADQNDKLEQIGMKDNLSVEFMQLLDSFEMSSWNDNSKIYKSSNAKQKYTCDWWLIVTAV